MLSNIFSYLCQRLQAFCCSEICCHYVPTLEGRWTFSITWLKPLVTRNNNLNCGSTVSRAGESQVSESKWEVRALTYYIVWVQLEKDLLSQWRKRAVWLSTGTFLPCWAEWWLQKKQSPPVVSQRVCIYEFMFLSSFGPHSSWPRFCPNAILRTAKFLLCLVHYILFVGVS